MSSCKWQSGWWLAFVLSTSVSAQMPTGDGLQGAYYAGSNFEQYVATRHDATLNFEWHARRPLAGVGPEQFSVRWTGWLVPPRSGRYVLHLSTDDGCRLWLGEQQVLDDWQGQGLSYHQLAVELRAGQAYALRLDYRQMRADSRVRLTWEVPGNGGGAVVVPTRYLFRAAPTLPPAPAVAAAPPASPLPLPASQSPTPTSVLVGGPGPAVARKPRPRSYLAMGKSQPPAGPAAPVTTVTTQTATVAARLAAGQSVTLRALYFAQGQAGLRPAVRLSLDTLARALVSHPGLRLQVQGHTDNQGDPAINQQLSQRRADAVCRYLQAHGVAPYRLQALGLGGTQPVADNALPAERPRNRRVVLQPLPSSY